MLFRGRMLPLCCSVNRRNAAFDLPSNISFEIVREAHCYFLTHDDILECDVGSFYLPATGW